MAREDLLTGPSLAGRVATLGRLASGTFHAADRPTLLAVAGPLIVDCCRLDHLGISLLADDHVQVVSFDRTGRCTGPAISQPDTGLAVSVAAMTGELIYEPAVAHSLYPDLAGLGAAGLASAVVVPLRAGDKALGALVGARQQVGFEGHDLMTLDEAAAVMASALELVRTTEIAQRADVERHKAAMLATRRADEIAALDTIANALDRFELVHALSVMATELTSLRGIELCRISIVDPTGRLIEVASGSCHGARFGSEPMAADPDSMAVATGDLVLWRRPDASDEAMVDALARLGVSSVFALPIIWEGEILGAIMAGSTGGHRLVTDEHLVVADIAGQLLAQATEGDDGLRRLVARPV